MLYERFVPLDGASCSPLYPYKIISFYHKNKKRNLVNLGCLLWALRNKKKEEEDIMGNNIHESTFSRLISYFFTSNFMF